MALVATACAPFRYSDWCPCSPDKSFRHGDDPEARKMPAAAHRLPVGPTMPHRTHQSFGQGCCVRSWHGPREPSRPPINVPPGNAPRDAQSTGITVPHRVRASAKLQRRPPSTEGGVGSLRYRSPVLLGLGRQASEPCDQFFIAMSGPSDSTKNQLRRQPWIHR